MQTTLDLPLPLNGRMPHRLPIEPAPVVATSVAPFMREALTAIGGAAAALFVVEPVLISLLVFTTAIDYATAPWDRGRRAPLADVPGRLRASTWRMLQNAVWVSLGLAFANALPLFGLAADGAVGYAAAKAGRAALDHVLPEGHEFRLVFERIWRRFERAFYVEEVVEPPQDYAPPGHASAGRDEVLDPPADGAAGSTFETTGNGHDVA